MTSNTLEIVVKIADIEKVHNDVTRLLGVKCIARSSDYYGDYYGTGYGPTPEVAVQPNQGYDMDQPFFAFPDYQDYPIVIYIHNAPNQNEIRDNLLRHYGNDAVVIKQIEDHSKQPKKDWRAIVEKIRKERAAKKKET
jgi:hypothetical protein